MDIAEGLDKAVDTIKLEIEPQERARLLNELTKLLTWLEPLTSVDTSGTKAVLVGHNAVNAWRDDRAEAGEVEALQEAAPYFEERFYSVPPIIED